MNASRLDHSKWPRSRWFWSVLLALTAQMWLIFVLSEPEETAPFGRVETRVSWLRIPALEIEAGALFGLSDPALFALPHPSGFSGAAWLHLREISYPAFEWEEAPRWWQTAGAGLGEDFLAMVRSSGRPVLAALEKPVPPLAPVQIRPAPIQAGTSLRLLDGLAGWALLPAGPLPAHEEETILEPVLLRVLVRPSGEVHSPPLVERSSGSERADKKALEFLRGARFAPPEFGEAELEANAPLIFGRVLIEWFGGGAAE